MIAPTIILIRNIKLQLYFTRQNRHLAERKRPLAQDAFTLPLFSCYDTVTENKATMPKGEYNHEHYRSQQLSQEL